MIDLSTFAFVAYSYAGTTQRLLTKKGTETALPEFLSALDAAGMQTYLDAANAQLEAYLAAK